MNKKCVISLLIVSSVVISICCSPLVHYLPFDYGTIDMLEIKKLVDYNYVLASCGYVAAYAVLASFSLYGLFPLSIVGGFLFGMVGGSALMTVGATLGAFGSFLLTRHLVGNDFQKRYAPRLASFNSHLNQHGLWYLFSLRLMPFVPFSLVNIAAGFTTLSPLTFLWTTTVGVLPGSLVYAFVAEQSGSFFVADNALSPRIIIALVMLSLLVLLPVIVHALTDNEDLKS